MYIVNRKRNRNDLILIIILVVLPLAALSLNFAFGEKPAQDSLVVITVMGELYDKMPLDKDTVIEIETELGINHIEIKDGQVWMSYADCPDKLCVNHRAVSLTGGQIVCLPNQVVVSVESSGGNLDSISE